VILAAIIVLGVVALGLSASTLYINVTLARQNTLLVNRFAARDLARAPDEQRDTAQRFLGYTTGLDRSVVPQGPAVAPNISPADGDADAAVRERFYRDAEAAHLGRGIRGPS